MLTDGMRNTIKTISGLFVGVPLIEIIKPLNSFLISCIQCIFFIFFYTVLDKIIRGVEHYYDRKKSGKIPSG